MKQVFYNNRGEVYVKEVDSPTLQGTGAVVRTVSSFIGTGRSPATAKRSLPPAIRAVAVS